MTTCPSDLPITIFNGGAKNADTPILATLGAIEQWLKDPPDGGLAKYVRELAENDDDLFDTIKTSLPVALFSGHFSYRSNQTCNTYSPLVVIDLDDVEDAAAMRDSMAGDKHIAACFLSPSGRGIKPLIYTSSVGTHTHRHAWATACRYLAQTYGLDPSSSKGQHDVARSCFLGYDSGMWIAQTVEALPVDMSIIIEQPKDTREPHAGAEIITENRHQYLCSYTARLASIGLGQGEIMASAKVLIDTRFDKSDGRVFPEDEIERAVNGAAAKFQGLDEIKLLTYGSNIAGIFLALEQETNPIAAILVRNHDDRLRDTLVPPPELVEGLMYIGRIGSIIAKPGHGKTMVALELTRCIAGGLPFAGRKVQQGAVLYVCTDSPDSTERRMLGIDEAIARNVYTVAEAPRFPGGFAELCVAMDSIDNLRLVVLDTWDSNREHISGGYSEQDAQIETTLSHLRKVAKQRQLNFVVVHHATRGDGEVARGSQVFDARCDWMGTVIRTDDTLTVKTTKIRDGIQTEVGNWKITSAVHPQCTEGPTIPSLEFMSGLAAKADQGKQKLAADEAYLKIVLALLDDWKDEPPSIRTIHDATQAKWRGAVPEALAAMRDRGWCIPKFAKLTAEGRAAARELSAADSSPS